MREDLVLRYDELDEIAKHVTRGVTTEIERYGYKALRNDLWALTRRVASSWFVSDENIDFNKLVDLLQKLVEGAWQALELKRSYNFDHPTLLHPYIPNPFRKAVKFERETVLPQHLDLFMGKFTHLSKEESRNFFVAFENFFRVVSVVDWKHLLEQWRKFAYLEEVISDGGWDSNPLLTYEALLKLVEASTLAVSWTDCPYDKHPNRHLFMHGEVVVHIDPANTNCNNPLQELNWTLGVYNATILKTDIINWLECAAEKDLYWNRNEPGMLVDLYQEANMLLETGWLLTQLDEIPERWLDPNGDGFANYCPPKEDPKFKIEFLTPSQAENPYEVPGKLFQYTDLTFYRSVMTECLCHALQSQLEYPGYVGNVGTLGNVLLPLVEALYLINLDLAKRVTIVEEA